MSINCIALGKRICFYRLKFNITQEKLAALTNCSREYIAYLESGTKTPSLPTLIDLANVLHLQQMARTVAYVQEHGYDSYEKLSDTTDAIQSKMAKARSDAKFTEAKLKKVNEQIRYLGQYLSTKSVYGDFLKSTNKKSFRQAHAEDIAKYEEALRILKQHSPDGRFPTMKDLRAEKEQLTIQKDAQYDTYHYFKDYHRELQTVCANVDNILGTEREARREQQQSRKNEHSR